MRFVLRPGTGPSATADVAMLSAIGLPGGGIISVGETTVRVVPAQAERANELRLPARAFENGRVAPGQTVDVQRAVVPEATSVTITRGGEAVPAIPRELMGSPVQPGERFDASDGEITIDDVHPVSGGILSPATVAIIESAQHSEVPIEGDAALSAG
ncbi:MAG: hypothetical protein ACR2N7_02605, partial [Acidimicrobiia bacterium]